MESLQLFKESELPKQHSFFVDGPRLKTKIKANKEQSEKIQSMLASFVWPDNYFICRNTQDLSRVAREISKHRRFSFDTEFSGFHPWRGELYCVSFYVGDKGYLVNLKHPMIPAIRRDEFATHLGSYFSDDSIEKIGFYMHGDCHYIEEQLKIPVGKFHFDSHTASWILEDDLPKGQRGLKALTERLLGIKGDKYSDLFGRLAWIAQEPKIAALYAIGDADKTLKLADWQEVELKKIPSLHNLFHKLEMPVQNEYYQLEKVGLPVDEDYLRNEVGPALDKQMEELFFEMQKHGMPKDIMLSSPEQIADFLFNDLKLPRINGNSTDRRVLDMLEDRHPIIPLMKDWRGAFKLKTGFVDSISALSINGRVHPHFNVIGSTTGRASCEGPNLFQMPAKAGPIIRRAFVAPEGYMLVSKDLKGQELRITAHFAKDEYLKQVALAGDIYAEAGSAFSGIPINELKKGNPIRDNGKVAVLALLYGAQAPRMARIFGCSVAKGKEFLDTFFQRFPGLYNFQQGCIQFGKANGYVLTVLGRRRTLDFKRVGITFQEKLKLERESINSPVQGSATDQIKKAYLECNVYLKEKGLKTRALFTIHDEIIFLAEKEEWETLGLDKVLDDIIINAVVLSIPFETSTEYYGSRWGEKPED